MTNDQLGQWGEHMAAAWFIRRGYNVYFPRSKHNPDVDFIVEKDNKTSSVQVKAGAHYVLGRGAKTPNPRVKCKNKGLFDYLFVIHTSGRARLYPKKAAPGAQSSFSTSGRSKHIYDVDFF